MAAPMGPISSALNGQKVPFNLTELDREVFAQTDEEFRPHDWEDVKNIVGGLAHTATYHYRGILVPDS